MSSRPSARLFQATQNIFRPNIFRQPLLRRRVQTEAAPTENAQAGGFAKFWNSPVGPKTVHFWAPIMKWSIVLAGLSDLTRPAETLSLNTNAALMATGAIWTRWCFIIKPRNLFLATVNFFLFLTGGAQVTRILLWRRSQEGKNVVDEAKELAVQVEEGVKESTAEAKESVKKLVK